MKIARCLHIAVVSVGLILPFASTLASAQELPENLQGVGLYELDRLTKARGDTAAAKADSFVSWMATNDLQSLEIQDLYNLYGFINVDSLDRCHFSARWTGSLTAPVSGAYTLQQVQVYRGTNSRLKIVIDGQAVLDTTQNPTSDAVFTSAPVQLTAGEPVPFQVDMVHDGPYINFSEGAPMVVLTWQRVRTEETIIPTTSFTPPAEFTEAGAHGLKGEYFATTDFQELRLTRLDPALDFVWSWPPVASIHNEETQQVFDVCTAKILDGDFLSQSVAEDNLVVLEHNLWRIAFRMTATQRQQLVETLRQRPGVLAAMEPVAMGKLMQAIYMLPNDDQIDLLGEWALARPQPRCEAGQFPGWGDGYYRKENTDYYWLMGQFLQGPYWNDAERLCDLYLERSNGDCNLAIAYAAAYAGRANKTGDAILNRLTEQIDEPSVQGDRLVTWLIARAFAAGVMGPRIEPLGGFSDLESAYISAESDEYKFWALEEMVARLSSVNQGERAKQLIEESRNRFSSPEMQASMTQWIAKADALAADYVKEQESQALAAEKAYRDQLLERRQQALARGDTGSAQRFGEMIDALGAAE